MNQIPNIAGGSAAQTTPGGNYDLPDGTVLGNGLYVYHGCAVTLDQLPDGLILSNGKIAYSGLECDLNRIPTGLLLSNNQVVIRSNSDLEEVFISGKPCLVFSDPGEMVAVGSLADGTQVMVYREGEFYCLEGRLVQLSDLPDGTILYMGTQILALAVNGERKNGYSDMSGYPLRDGRIWLCGVGPIDSFEKIPDGTMLYDGRIAWKGKAVSPAEIPDGAVIFTNGVPNTNDPPDRVMKGGQPVEFQQLPELFRLLDGRYVFKSPYGMKIALPQNSLPDFTILPGGKVMYHGIAYSLLDLLVVIENEMIGKEENTFMNYYNQIRDRNQYIEMMNKWLTKFAGEKDKDNNDIYLGQFTITDYQGNSRTMYFREWMEELGMGKIWEGNLIDNYSGPYGPQKGGVNVDKGGLATLRETINAKIKEKSSDNEMDMIFLNQANNEKSTRIQQLIQLCQKCLEMMSGAAAAIKS